MRGLMVYMKSDVGAPWSDKVWAYDACPSGHASVSWNGRPSLVRATGRWQERWRYKDDDLSRNARDRALGDSSVAQLDRKKELKYSQNVS